MQWFRRHPVLATLAPALLVALALTAGLWNALSGEWLLAPWLLSWLAVVNIVAFVTYGFDKGLARREGRRIPEITLLTLAFVGGSLGAYAGMRVFRHKTLKGSFRTAFWVLVAVQVVLILVLARYVWLA